VIDDGDHGAGKTYVAAFVDRTLGLYPRVVCQKSAVGIWRRAPLAVGCKDREMYVTDYEQ
jgi:hypothetical protein